MGKPGPKTKVGKELVRLNAMKHGVLASTPVIPGLEREEDWEAHREGVLESLGPEGHLEVTLAERVALLLWRLQRMARYEREMIAVAQEQVDGDLAERRALRADIMLPGMRSEYPEDVAADLQAARETLALIERLPGMPDDAPMSGDDAAEILSAVGDQTEMADPYHFSLPGVPDGVAREEFTDWSAGLVREGIAAIAAHEAVDPAELWSAAAEGAHADVKRKKFDADQVAAERDRMRRERLLPDAATLDKVMRYEAHLNRQLNQTLHELEALQARRQGGVAPLARLDVQGLPEN